MKRNMFIKKMAERYNMANSDSVNNKVSFTASENSVVIKIGDVTMVFCGNNKNINRRSANH